MGVALMRGLEGDKYDRQYDDRYLFKRILNYFSRYRLQVISVIVAFLVLAVVAALRPVLIASVVSALAEPDGSGTLRWIVVVLVIAAVLEYGMNWVRRRYL